LILVTTPGKVGSAAARMLTQRGVPVRVLARLGHPARSFEQFAADYGAAFSAAACPTTH